MVEYGARIEEFDRGVGEAQKKDVEYERSGGQPIVLSRYLTFRLFLSGTYMEWRDKALNEGLETLNYESPSVTGRQQQSKWSSYYSGQGQQAFQKITDFVKSDKAPNLHKFGEEVASQESQFFNLVARAPLASFQGSVQQKTVEFYKEANNLERKWKEMADQDRSIDEKAKATSREVLRIIDEVMRGMIQEERAGEERLKSITNTAKNIPGLPLPITLPLVAADKMLELAGRLKKKGEELSMAYTDAYKREEPIVIIFAQTRAGVKEFLDKTNLDSATKEFNAANEESKSLANQCPTPRQREDAKRFMEKAANLAFAFLDKFKKEYTDFVNENRGIFVGPVSDKTLDELLEVQDWEKSWEEMERLNIQTKLKELYGDCVRAWHVDLEGLTDEQKKELNEFFEMELRRVSQGVYEATEGSLWERIKRAHLEDRHKLLESAKKSGG